MTNLVLKISDDVIVTSFLNQSQQNFVLCLFFQEALLLQKLQKVGNDVIVTSFLKIALQFFVCEYFVLIPIHVPSLKLIEGQIKELQGMVPNTPLAENDQKARAG